jgi:hypothetical protein
MTDGGQTKITYATMTADRTDVHHELMLIGRCVIFRSYPLMTPPQYASSEFDDRSPIDTRRCPALQSASRQRVSDAVPPPGAFPAGARPWRGGGRSGRPTASASTVGRRRSWAGGKNRLECVGDVEESADLIGKLLRAAQSTTGSGAGDNGPGEGNVSVPATVSGGHFTVQLSARPRCRALGRGAGGRQHGRLLPRVGHSGCWATSCAK